MESDGEGSSEPDQQAEFNAIGAIKCKMSPEELCNTNESVKLLPFVKEIYALSYGSEPDYNKLIMLLVKEMLNMDIAPTKEFDWNQNAMVEMKQ